MFLYGTQIQHTFNFINLIVVGIRRPAALWCVGEDSQLDLPDYEVALVEPLHDFRTIINRVLCELPHMATETPLQNALTEIVDVIRGSYPHGSKPKSVIASKNVA